MDILRAIAFSAHAVSADVIKRMGLFRISNEYFDDETRSQFPGIDKLESMPAPKFITLYRRTASTDDLSKFVEFLEEYRQE